MQEEPVAFFHEVLQQDSSVLDFLHAHFGAADFPAAAVGVAHAGVAADILEADGAVALIVGVAGTTDRHQVGAERVANQE